MNRGKVVHTHRGKVDISAEFVIYLYIDSLAVD